MMVRLTCLTLEASRSAICSAFLTVPATNSSSHCRPLAIAVTRVARVSDRIGRASVRDDGEAGEIISLRCFDGIFFQSIFNTIALRGSAAEPASD